MTGFIGIDKNSRRLEAVNDVSGAEGGVNPSWSLQDKTRERIQQRKDPADAIR